VQTLQRFVSKVDFIAGVNENVRIDVLSQPGLFHSIHSPTLCKRIDLVLVSFNLAAAPCHVGACNVVMF
jgi:hypothetical protein